MTCWMARVRVGLQGQIHHRIVCQTRIIWYFRISSYKPHVTQWMRRITATNAIFGIVAWSPPGLVARLGSICHFSRCRLIAVSVVFFNWLRIDWLTLDFQQFPLLRHYSRYNFIIYICIWAMVKNYIPLRFWSKERITASWCVSCRMRDQAKFFF